LTAGYDGAGGDDDDDDSAAAKAEKAVECGDDVMQI